MKLQFIIGILILALATCSIQQPPPKADVCRVTQAEQGCSVQPSSHMNR